MGFDCYDANWNGNERFASEEMYKLSELLGRRNPKAQAHGALGGEWGYGQHFKNDVFEMHPFCWNDDDHDTSACGCSFNFRCGDLEIDWYKWIGRDMSVNRPVSQDELAQIFQRCRKSIAN